MLLVTMAVSQMSAGGGTGDAEGSAERSRAKQAAWLEEESEEARSCRDYRTHRCRLKAS